MVSNFLPLSFSADACDVNVEVVMSMLLKSFRFTPSTKKILWEMNGIVQPTTAEAEVLESGDKRLELPLGVSLVSPRSC